MNNLFVNFILESGLSLSVLSLIYILFLRKETFFGINRIFLLASVLFSLVLPFLSFRILRPGSVMLEEVMVTPYQNMLESVTVYSQGLSGSVEQVILSTNPLIIMYLTGVVLFLGIFLFRLVQITHLIRTSEIKKVEGYKLVLIQKEITPFSFLDYIFISRSLQNDIGIDRMMQHEMEHVKQGHSIDIVVLEIIKALQWFNPFIWLLRRAIRENHEFLADRAVLAAGISRGQYKKLLLNQFLSDQVVLANHFNYSLIKNRIKMMSKIKSTKLSQMKLFMGIAVATMLLVVFACEQNQLPDSLGETDLASIEKSAETTVDQEANLNPTKEVFFIVEKMPEYPGGDMALRQYISGAVQYPKEAIQSGKQGKVYVTFVVSPEGSVTDAKIARGVDPLLDEEALRVVNGMERWEPGVQKGKKVNVSYTVPINFVLK